MNTFPLIRAAYASTVITAPRQVLRLYGGRPAGTADIAVIRVLGARHLIQAALTARSTHTPPLLIGAAADAAHALSMAGLGLLDPPRRREALVDAAIAASFATAGVLLALRGNHDHATHAPG